MSKSLPLKGLVAVPFLLSVILNYSAHAYVGARDAASTRAINAALEMGLAKHPTWKSLLHFQAGECHISGPAFMLSGDSCSLEKELVETIRSFYGPANLEDEHAICKFPARYYFIERNIAEVNITLPSMSCESLEEYLRKVPADSISLVFASENVTQPSSMMGHVFLKLSGKNNSGVHVDHAVTYFTRINSFNLPMLVVDSLVLGMPSFYALVPYSEQLRQYFREEARNIWEYSLALSPETRELIHLHIWELKDTQSKYLFAGYNCATVVYFILSIADPHCLDVPRFWVTPLDVVKQANKDKLVSKTVLLPSIKWKIRMLASELDTKSQTQIYNAVLEGNLNSVTLPSNDEQRFLQLDLGNAFSRFRFQRGIIPADQFAEFRNSVKAAEAELPSNRIDVSKFKNPLSKSEDSQFSLGSLYRDHKTYLKLNLLPASHKITDNNSQSFGENSLELGDVTVLLRPEDGAISFEEFKLYSSLSLIPWDRFTGGLSGRFQIGVERHLDKQLNGYSAVHVLGGLGLSSLIHRDVLLYSIGNVGVAFGKWREYAYGYPEVGLVVDEVSRMKGLGSYKFVCGQHGSWRCYSQIDITQSIFANPQITFLFGYRRSWRSEITEDSFEVSVRRYF